MSKLRLFCVMCACIIGFNGVSTVAAERALYYPDTYGSQNMVVNLTETEVGNATTNRSDNFNSTLLNAFIVIGCGLIGLAMLRKANKE